MAISSASRRQNQSFTMAKKPDGTSGFKTVNLAFQENLLDAYKNQLFPDTEALKKSEQYRFELLLAHWDIETGNDILP